MTKGISTAILLGCQMGFTAPSTAGELILKDGLRLLGKVGIKDGNTLEFETSFAGVVKIQCDQVAELKTDEPVPVLLSNDESITAQGFGNEEQAVFVEAEPGAPVRSLAGQDSSRRLLKPITVEVIFSLSQAGWPTEILLSVALQRINNIENTGFGQG